MGGIMETPLKITFHGGETSEALSNLINESVADLEHLHGRMTACHVTLQVPDRMNGRYAVHIRMTLPGGLDLNVDHAPSGDERFFDPLFAVNDAFRRARRVLKDHSRKRRGETKTLHRRIERTLDEPEP
jgi:ribosome-associated translation inhibitor RaiA